MLATAFLAIGLRGAAAQGADAPAAPPNVRALVSQAATQYGAGDFAGAAATLEKAYALQPAPRLLYNLARAHDKAGDWQEAYEDYRRYVDGPGAEPDLVTRAQEAMIRLEHVPSPPTPASASPAPPVAPSSSVSALPAAPATATPTPADTRSHTLSWMLVGGGAAALAAGVGVGIWANATASQEKSSTDPVAKPALRDSAYSRAIAADVTMGIGAAALITGIVLRFVAPARAPTAPAAVTVGVYPAGIEGRF
jgi:hypothetical protein